MYHFLNACKRIEDISCQIYQLLSNERTYSKEVRKAFKQLSDDERAHANQIDLVVQANAMEIKTLPTISDKSIKDALRHAEQMLRKVMEAKLSEKMALQLAVEMEKRFVGVHAHNALNFQNQKLTELFRELGKEDENHVDTLQECLT
ncbi:MAG TPA: ferritin family protein [Geopsychrobacteraceae bacterium]|nr:ferritin family protein [Geopsychrobacteraceae bacterium]